MNWAAENAGFVGVVLAIAVAPFPIKERVLEAAGSGKYAEPVTAMGPRYVYVDPT
jgi:hypothetical protein